MSGGRWNYGQCNLGYDMFPGCDVCYGLGDDSKNKYSSYFTSVKLARKLNPLEDKQLSELAFDLLCLIYSADWYMSCDTGEEDYRADVEYFKKKWLKKDASVLAMEELNKILAEVKEEIISSLGIKEGEDK